MRTRIDLAPGARLVFREEQVLGRHGEAPGTLTTRLTVHRAGRPLLDQELAFGPGAPGGWDGGAVLGGHRAAGQLLVVARSSPTGPPRPGCSATSAVLTPLMGPAFLVTALAPDARLLRRTLDDALRAYRSRVVTAQRNPPSGYRFGKETPVRPVHRVLTDERIPRQAQMER